MLFFHGTQSFLPRGPLFFFPRHVSWYSKTTPIFGFNLVFLCEDLVPLVFLVLAPCQPFFPSCAAVPSFPLFFILRAGHPSLIILSLAVETCLVPCFWKIFARSTSHFLLICFPPPPLIIFFYSPIFRLSSRVPMRLLLFALQPSPLFPVFLA